MKNKIVILEWGFTQFLRSLHNKDSKKKVLDLFPKYANPNIQQNLEKKM